MSRSARLTGSAAPPLGLLRRAKSAASRRGDMKPANRIPNGAAAPSIGVWSSASHSAFEAPAPLPSVRSGGRPQQHSWRRPPASVWERPPGRWTVFTFGTHVCAGVPGQQLSGHLTKLFRLGTGSV